MISNITEQILKSIGERNRMSDVIYMGEPAGSQAIDGHPVFVLRDGEKTLLPHLEDRSPGGFDWGYGGSGPAELSRCILADFFGKDSFQVTCYFDFKWHVIAPLKRGQEFKITGSLMNKWWEKFLDRNPLMAEEVKRAREHEGENGKAQSREGAEPCR